MKISNGYIFFLLLFMFFVIGCNRNEQPLEKVKEYNSELKDLKLDSLSLTQLTELNAEFKENGLKEFSKADFQHLKSSEEFKTLLASEKILLDDWKPVASFPDYSTKQTDTLRGLIRRCSAFDRGGPETLRAPSFRQINAVSLRYYRFEIPVVFHIVTMANGTGSLPEMNNKINAQIALLNTVYAKCNVLFRLYSIDKTANNSWHQSASYYTNQAALNAMTTTLSIHPEKIMNVFMLGSQVLGEATFPNASSTNGTPQDYVLINYNTLPGGPVGFEQGMYSQGKTLVHEAGHYMGLYHTFEGGDYDCKTTANDGCNIGDQVDDTPSQKICYFTGCGFGTDGIEMDSCPAPGKDPVKNYMGYNPDACMNELTDGQAERIIRSLLTFRPYFKKEVV